MEPTTPYAPEISISAPPRSPSFFNRVLRRTFSGGAQSPPADVASIPTLNLPAFGEHDNNNNTPRSRPQSRSSSRSSHKRRAISDSPIESSSPVAMKTSKTGHLTVDTQVCSNARSRSRSRSRSKSRGRSPNPEMMDSQPTRVASINHVGRHTNDWLFGGFHLTPKIGAPRGRAR